MLDNLTGVRSKFQWEGGEGVVAGERVNSERCLKWGGGGWGEIIKESFQKHLEIGGR